MGLVRWDHLDMGSDIYLLGDTRGVEAVEQSLLPFSFSQKLSSHLELCYFKFDDHDMLTLMCNCSEIMATVMG